MWETLKDIKWRPQPQPRHNMSTLRGYITPVAASGP